MSAAVPLHDPRDAVTDEQSGSVVSTGRLPSSDIVQASLLHAFDRYRPDDSGLVADYIPALAGVDPDLFGIAVVGAGGAVHTVGDAAVEFSIQSISKAFVFALVDEALGHETVRERVGVNNTGLPFNSLLAIELNAGSPSNPMVNAGALAVTSLVPGDSVEARWEFIRDGLSRFAGRPLGIDETVYASESASNQRNQSIAWLLDSYERMSADPVQTTDVYTRQCSLSVSGGIVTVAPGKGGLGTFSPRLDAAGNSVRGQRVAHYLSGALGLNLFGSVPITDTTRA